MTQAPTTEDRTRRRRFITASLVGVIAIGVVGMVAAFVITDDTTEDPVTRPGATTDPISVEGKCRAAAVVRFDVTRAPGAAAEFTATGAVEPWVLKGESSLTTNAGEDSKLVSIGASGEPPRVVLTVERKDAAWFVTETAGCLDATDSPRACPTETVTVGRTTYSRSADEPATASPSATYVGTGTLSTCPANVDGQRLAARGAIAPVSAFAAEGKPGAVVVTDDQGTRRFTR